VQAPRPAWSEANSDTYRRIAAIAVPRRREQFAALLTLVPFSPQEEFQAVELGSGEGRLAAAILEAFPRARITALDGSESMRAATANRLAAHEGRFEVDTFDLFQTDWHDHLNGAGLVVSSLVVHHLDGAGKQALFKQIRARMDARAALLIADLVDPKRRAVRELFAATYDRAARDQSQEVAGSDAYYLDFLREEWNFFRFPDDEMDIPSPLFEQLNWLDAAGFDAVDCFWLQAGHAIYGGYVGDEPPGDGLPYERALEIAEKAVG
jgi:trans-aconitate methyltransferase